MRLQVRQEEQSQDQVQSQNQAKEITDSCCLPDDLTGAIGPLSLPSLLCSMAGGTPAVIAKESTHEAEGLGLLRQSQSHSNPKDCRVPPRGLGTRNNDAVH